MENRKDIGKIFKEKIDYLDKEPNNDGWDAIQSELDKKKKKRLIFIPFWFKSIGLLTAGSLCLWLVTNHSFENKTLFGRDAKSGGTQSNDTHTNSKKNSPITTLQNNTKSRSDVTTITVAVDSALSSKENVINKRTPKQNSNSIVLASLKIHASSTTLNKRKRFANNEKNKLGTKSSNYLNKKSKTKSYKTKITNQSSTKTKKNTKNKNLEKSPNVTSPLETAIVANAAQLDEDKITEINTPKKIKKAILKTSEKDTITNPEIKDKSFELFIYGSPTISGLSKSKSLLDNRLNNNPTTSNITFSYGTYFCYQVTSNLSLRLGLSIINLNLITDDIPVNTTDYSNISYASEFSNAYIYSQSNNSEYMKITQKISYIEIPLEVKYRFVNQKIDINAIIGLNYLYLNNNEIVALTSNGSEFKIGKTKDLLDRTLGVNIGLGFDYNLTKKIKFNIEPMFKYHFKNSQNDDETKLFSLNILTGLQIKFGQ
jgi:uncharacterized protein YmfQ (DUF2313 family)